jgi:hypothetical protein
MLAEVLTALRVPERFIDLELSQMDPFAFAATRGRTVLGSMTDFVLNFRYMLPLEPDFRLLDWSLRLADIPCGPIGMGWPKNVAPEMLRARYGLAVIDGGAN